MACCWVLLLVQDIPKAAPRVATGAWADALRQRPRLLGPKAHLASLSRARPEVYKEIAGSEALVPRGIVRAVEGLPGDKARPLIDAALKHVRAGPTNRHQDTWIALTDAALTYDLFFDEIAAADRASIVEWMNAHLGVYTDDENAFHNSTLSKILCYLRIAYATWGENPKAREFRDYAIVKLYEGKVVPVLLEFGAGGGFTEGGWYARGSLWHLVQALELARRLEKYDGFQKAPRFFYQRLAYEMFQPYPGLWTYGAERYPMEGDGAIVYGGHNEYPRHLRTVLAQYFRGSELARAVMNRRRRGSNFEARLADFLFEEEAEPPLDLAAFPLAHLASGIGRVYARGDWTDDAAWLRFECGDYWAGHQHFEVGNFEIFRREPLATESGEYHDYGSSHSVNWLLRTVAHNCVLVHRPGEEWKNLRDGGRHPYANDGGQAKKWEWTVDTLELWKKRRESFDRGDVVAYENRPEFMYVAGDCTRAYDPAKLSLWIRQIVFVRPHATVIFDRVVSTRADYAKTWLLHCRNEPEIVQDTVTIRDGKGKLVVESLLPDEARVRKVSGYRYDGQTFDAPRTVHSDLAAKWRIEVTPEPAEEDLFLHVLWTDEPKPCTLIQKGAEVGVKAGTFQVIFRGKVGGSLDNGKVQFALKPGIKAGKYE
jgi:hypothetical protein